MLAGEQIDDLQCGGLRILQKRGGAFRYGTDSVLLANNAVIPNGARVLDIGTGTGILPILLSAKSKAGSLVGLEVQPDMADMAKRSVRLNNLEEKISIRCGNVKDSLELFGKASFDAVVTNPPYKRAGSGIKNSAESAAVARHEIEATLEDFISGAAKLLKPGGHFTMICRPERLADAVEFMRKYRLEPKRLTFIYPKPECKPTMFLLYAVLYGGKNLLVTEPIILN